MLCLCYYSHLVRRHSGFLMACVKMWRIVGDDATHSLTPTQSISYVVNVQQRLDGLTHLPQVVCW
jgi:hypothetical protein